MNKFLLQINDKDFINANHCERISINRSDSTIEFVLEEALDADRDHHSYTSDPRYFKQLLTQLRQLRVSKDEETNH